ncbi:TonB-dependent receptor [Hyphomicrobium sp.]|uniref:TonB-dependent receptor family protein n=1 Tax=Hyphomicrobium sp. TaxID=82 RepID=UPI0025C3A46F|nr:TonB-dependent receptor [Hyphomicrobium sp.]MCC7252414.1 TonB-dependent receptor [Hyphomicrobium sp.]
MSSCLRPQGSTRPTLIRQYGVPSALSVAILSVALGAPSSAQEAVTELPEVTVTTTAPTGKPKAKAAKSAPAAIAQQPSSAEAEAPSDGSDHPQFGARSGSLGVPTVAEATVEIERTPGGVDLVPAEEYKTSTPAVTLKDALDYVPGVLVQPKWGEDSRLSIRGSGLSRNFHGRGVLLLIDGIIPLSTADGASDFQEIDPTAFRYIEVYKGGNALRYGANTLGGALNFVMPTGYDSDLFGARVDVGSFGFHKLSASSGGVFGAADYFITGTWQEQDGFRDHSEGESTRGAMNVGYRLTPDVETRFYLSAAHIRQDIPGAVTKQQALSNPEGAFVLPGEPSLPFFPFSTGNDNVDRDFERNIDAVRVANRTTVRLAPGTVAEFGAFYRDKQLDHPILFVLDNDTQEKGGFARIVDDSRIGGFRNTLVAGVSIHNGETRSRFYRNILGERGALMSDSDQKSDNTIVYAENSFFVQPTVALVAGLQYVDAERAVSDNFLSDGNSSGKASFDFWNPKAGIAWDVTPFAQVFANVSRSGEAPTFSEITVTPALTTSLDPQRATTYEIGTRGSTPDFKWDLALYRSNIDNEFQCLTVGSSLCNQVNADKTIHQGVELGVGAALWSGIIETAGRLDQLWLNAAYTFSDFRFDDDADYGDNELPGAPRHYLRAELVYKHPSGVFFGPNIEWVPEAYFVDNENTFKTDAYAIWGARIGYEGETFSAYLEGRNLSDEAYIASASVSGDLGGADGAVFEPGTGRAIYGGFQVKW